MRQGNYGALSQNDDQRTRLGRGTVSSGTSAWLKASSRGLCVCGGEDSGTFLCPPCSKYDISSLRSCVYLHYLRNCIIWPLGCVSRAQDCHSQRISQTFVVRFHCLFATSQESAGDMSYNAVLYMPTMMATAIYRIKEVEILMRQTETRNEGGQSFVN